MLRVVVGIGWLEFMFMCVLCELVVGGIVGCSVRLCVGVGASCCTVACVLYVTHVGVCWSVLFLLFYGCVDCCRTLSVVEDCWMPWCEYV